MNLNHLSTDFFHLIHDIHLKHRISDGWTHIDDKPGTIMPVASLAFPSRDVKAKQDAPDAVTLLCQFMGLYGVDSPLPGYLNHQCLDDGEEGTALRAFLDIFNHRHYVLFYLSWRAFLPEAALSTGLQNYNDFIQSMTGWLTKSHTQAVASTIHPQSSQSLAALLHHLLPNIPCTIKENRPTWTRVNHQALSHTLGQSLGHDALLGNQILDASSHIQIQLGPIHWQDTQLLLTNQALSQTIHQYVTQKMGVHLTFEYQLLIEPSTTHLTLNPNNYIGLGQHAWLGNAPQQHFVITLNPPKQHGR